MTFLSGVKTLENVPRDAQGHAFPDVGEDRSVRVPATSGCAGCSKFTAHGEPCRALASRVLFGDQRADLVHPEHRIDADYLRDLQSYFFKLGYVANGYPGLQFIYNLGIGTANNVVQHTTYEILSIDPENARRLRWRGPDPRAVGFPISVPNPDFVAPGLGEPRLLTLPGSNRLPVGSSVLFQFPSCLFGRLNPYIEKIEEPSGEVGGTKDFWVVLSHTARYARTPWDAAFPPADGKYFALVYSYLVSPEGWDDYQGSTPEAQFALREDVEYDAGDIEDGELELLDSDGGSCRVLLLGDRLRVVLEFEGGEAVLVPDAMARIRTEDTDVNQWRTTLDLQGISLEGLERVVVTYWPEAVAGDEVLINGRGRCAYSKYSIDGYGEATDGFICENTQCSKYQAGKYGGATCWDTEATGFTLEAQEADSERALMSKFWSAEPLTLQQGGVGSQIGSAASSHRNFAFNRAGGRVPSVLSVCGGFFHRPLVAVSVARTDSWFGPRMGARRTFTDNDGRPWHEVKHGFFENDTAGLSAPVTKVAGWSGRKNARGVNATGPCAIFPTHRGPSCSVVNFAMGPDPSPHIRLARDGDEEVRHATAISRVAFDTATDARVRREII